MVNSRLSAKQRAFQSLPRALRRRTASHNVKRIPKRLRNRAEKEMADDNTPVIHGKKLRAYARVKQMAIERQLQRSKEAYENLKDGQTFGPAGIYNKAGINELATPPPGKAKYQHRQKAKTWLPTHVWHAKRAHLETKWGFSVVKTPTQKSYRPTHRASTIQGAVAWDTSFYSTIILEGEVIGEIGAVLSKVVRSEVILSERYKSGTRSWEGLIYDDKEVLGPGLIYWCRREAETKDPCRVAIRAHPAYFTNLFAFIKSIKSENVTLYDCRFTIGSIDITGPSSLPSLTSVLKLPDAASPALKSAWKALGSISNTSSLPRGVVLTFDSKDPRFSYPPQAVRKAKESDVVQLVTEWPDKEVIKTSSLFSPSGVNQSYVNQCSQKEVERRKRNAGPGATVMSEETDPSIPIILFRKHDNSWSMLLPWGWVLPVWHSLLHINDVHLGGTEESHQIALESGRLHFPDDYPATNAGCITEHERGQDRKKTWAGKPPGKRVSFTRLKLRKNEERGEVGSPFRSDWQYLYENVLKLPHSPKEIAEEDEAAGLTELDDNVRGDIEMADEEPKDTEESGSPMEIDEPPRKKRKIKHTIAEKKAYTPAKLPIHIHYDIPSITSTSTVPTMPVKLKYLHRGSPQSAARIYKIPDEDHKEWLKALKSKQTQLDDFPECPSAEHLIGFVTTGAFNLKEGSGFGIGTILSNAPADQYCLVRNVGTVNARIAKWERIAI